MRSITIDQWPLIFFSMDIVALNYVINFIPSQGKSFGHVYRNYEDKPFVVVGHFLN